MNSSVAQLRSGSQPLQINFLWSNAKESDDQSLRTGRTTHANSLRPDLNACFRPTGLSSIEVLVAGDPQTVSGDYKQSTKVTIDAPSTIGLTRESGIPLSIQLSDRRVQKVAVRNWMPAEMSVSDLIAKAAAQGLGLPNGDKPSSDEAQGVSTTGAASGAEASTLEGKRRAAEERVKKAFERRTKAAADALAAKTAFGKALADSTAAERELSEAQKELTDLTASYEKAATKLLESLGA